jgi:hypothetical protein
MKKYTVKRDRYQYMLVMSQTLPNGGVREETVGYYTSIENLLLGARQRLLRDKTKNGIELAALIDDVMDKNTAVLEEVRAFAQALTLAKYARRAKVAPPATNAEAVAQSLARIAKKTGKVE